MEIKEYIRSLIKYDNPILPELEPQETTRADTRSFMEPEVAKLINTFILSMNAKNVLELGTCVGYSGIWMAEALKKTGGMLTTVDYDVDLLKEAKANVQKAGVAPYIKIIESEISVAIKKFPAGSFDMVIQDARKSLYPELLEEFLRLVRRGGLIIADDTLYTRSGTAEKIREPLKKYNELVFADERLYSVILPVGEGVTISLKQ
jgi:predicted O-methyltransferase YrrM